MVLEWGHWGSKAFTPVRCGTLVVQKYPIPLKLVIFGTCNACKFQVVETIQLNINNQEPNKKQLACLLRVGCR